MCNLCSQTVARQRLLIDIRCASSRLSAQELLTMLKLPLEDPLAIAVGAYIGARSMKT